MCTQFDDTRPQFDHAQRDGMAEEIAGGGCPKVERSNSFERLRRDSEFRFPLWHATCFSLSTSDANESEKKDNPN
jgi:hypothetical protein